MPPIKQGRKQRARGKMTSNISRERTILTLAEDPVSAPPYMLPSQTSFTPTLGNMYASFHHQQGQQQQPGVSISDMTGFQYPQQQPNIMHPFGSQGSAFLNHMQQAFQGSNTSASQQQPQSPQQQNSGEVSDVEKLRKLKQTILSGQHPFFQAVPNPDALANLYLGPHPASQATKEQNQPQSAQPGPLPQSQSDDPKSATAPQRSDGTSQIGSAPALSAAKRPETPNTSLGNIVSRVSGSLPTPQSLPPSAFIPTGAHQTQNTNGSVGSARIDHSSGRPHPGVIIPPKSHDFRTSTPSPLPPSSVRSNALHSQQHRRGSMTMHSSGAPAVKHEDSSAPHSTSAAASATFPDDGAGGDKPPLADSERKDSTQCRDAQPDAPSPGGLDRDRSGYLPYDSPKFSHPSDPRDTGRFASRYQGSRYDRDRDWGRGRDWESDRERDREGGREKERDRTRDRVEFDRSGRPPLDRRPPPPAPTASVDKPAVPLDQRPVPGLGPPQHRADNPPHSEQRRPDEPRRPEVPAHPEQRPFKAVSPPEQPSRRFESNVSRSARVPMPPSVEQRRPDSALYSNRSPHDRDRFRPLPRRGSPANAGPFPPHRADQGIPPASPPTDDRRGLPSAPSDQRAPPGNNVTRSVPPSPETTRRPDPTGSPERNAPRPPTGPSFSNNTSRSVPDRRLSHRPDLPPPRDPLAPDSRAGLDQGHDDRDISRPFYSNAALAIAPRAMTRAASPGPRRPIDSSFDAPRERDRPLSIPSAPYRDPPPAPSSVVATRGYSDDSRRQSSEPDAPRRASDNFYPHPSSPAQPAIERREEVRQWREREGYPPASYPGTDADRERIRRYPDSREWQNDTYGRERDSRGTEPDVFPRSRPPPPTVSWERDRPVDMRAKDKERDGYGGWSGTERKYSGPGGPLPPPPPPSRWEDPVTHPNRPLQSRLTDSYDDRFIPREVAERARYPSPPPNTDVAVRDNFRDNSRVRQRSPSPPRRPGVFDDTHRAPKRAREEYEAPSRPPFFDDTRRASAPDYPPRAPSPQPYYDPRTPALAHPRDPAPYNRDRAPDSYPRRDMPPPRSPPFYTRDRFQPR